jgi:hypothetical protein
LTSALAALSASVSSVSLPSGSYCPFGGGVLYASNS